MALRQWRLTCEPGRRVAATMRYVAFATPFATPNSRESALLAELLLLFVATELSGHHGCFGHAEKAYSKLWFVL